MVSARLDRLDRDIKEAIQEMLEAGQGPTPIFNTIKANFSDRAPSKSTVERIFREENPPDTSPKWNLTCAHQEDVRLVLDVLAVVIERSAGFKTTFTQLDAKMVLMVRKAAPELDDFWRVWQLATIYKSKRLGAEGNKDTTALDAYLAFKPWVSMKAAIRYQGALVLSGVKPLGLPTFLDDSVRNANKELEL